MVQVSPFRALRYDRARVGDLSRVVAPPYDIISAAEHDALYARHPENVIRIDLTRPLPGEPEDGKYARAAQTLEAWVRDGVLVRDDPPAFYVLAQTYAGPDGRTRTRTGFFCRAKLTPLGAGPILPHERTLAGPKTDRLALMRATRQNLSPIFGLYRDPGQEIAEVLHEATAGAPIAEATLNGVENRMWRIVAPEAQRRLREVLERAPGYLYIADGHHRYETGLAYRDERLAAAARAGEAPPPEGFGYEYILTFASAVEDPGMAIFPLHRLLHGLTRPIDGPAGLVEGLGRFFEVRPAPAAPEEARAALAAAQAAPGRTAQAFLLVSPAARALLVARPDAPWHEVQGLERERLPDRSYLDVTILHAVVLEHALGISREAQARQLNLRYAQDFREAFAAPSSGEIQAAILMNPTRIEQVLAVAEARQVMPQKSTFFYPKVPSGLVLCPLDLPGTS